MALHENIEAADGVRPFNAYLAYEEVRAENRALWDALSRSLDSQTIMADRLEARGVDVDHHRDFIRNIRSRVLS